MRKTPIQLPTFEIDLILAHIFKKTREYILAHPELGLTEAQNRQFQKLINRRKNHEPMAYILGRKEFYGLDFKVTRDTLIPRPETEHLIEEILKINPKDKTIIDVGTGSGNIIISLAKSIREKNNYFGVDISSKALTVAKHNAKENKVDSKIKFIKSNLLDVFILNTKYKILNTNLIIVANLPYLSKKIYNSTSPDVKNFEPKSALLSGKDGLDHYEKLLEQIKKLKKDCYMLHVTCYMEISPEQKTKLEKIIKKIFPSAKISFQKDLAGKWRVAIIKI